MFCAVVLFAPGFSAENQSLCKQQFFTHQICVYHESLCGKCRKRILRDHFQKTPKSLPPLQYFFPKLAKKWKSRSFSWKTNFIILQSSWHFDCDTFFGVIVYHVNERFDDVLDISNGNFKDQAAVNRNLKLWRLRKYCIKEDEIPFYNS